MQHCVALIKGNLCVSETGLTNCGINLVIKLNFTTFNSHNTAFYFVFDLCFDLEEKLLNPGGKKSNSL